MTIKCPTLYKRTSTGAIQEWWMEIDGSKYRIITGELGSERIESEWKQAQPKNVGRKNETTAEAEAVFEVDAQYKKKLEQGYSYKLIEEGDM